MTFARQFGPLGLSASAGRCGEGWRAGLGLTIGLFRSSGGRGPDRWRAAPSGIARSGAIMAEMFVDDDGDGVRGPAEEGVEGGRFIVGAALRRETTNAGGRVLIGGIAPGPKADIETQMSSLTDFALRPLRPTGSIEVQVVLAAGNMRTPRSGVTVVLRDVRVQEAGRGVTDFEGFVLFGGLGFGSWTAEAAGQASPPLAVSRERPDQATRLLIPPAAGN